ncbi:uncharacterized protein LOC136074341 [Hydra vulgaris]|uniref:Uncharacterized protein LOC136074341 n=1 Tax=Hydra vulgaris TaxID=6087 RepID=A0ABM4B1T0_HYDVU
MNNEILNSSKLEQVKVHQTTVQGAGSQLLRNFCVAEQKLRKTYAKYFLRNYLVFTTLSQHLRKVKHFKEMDSKKYKSLLLKIEQNLLGQDVESIKFYYSQQIGVGGCEKITTPIELLKALEQRRLLGIDNYDAFVEVLEKIGRLDLAEFFSVIMIIIVMIMNISNIVMMTLLEIVLFYLDLSRVSSKLKKFYRERYEKTSEPQPPFRASKNVDLIQKFVDLCIVDAVTAQKGVFSAEREIFLEKQMSYTPISYSEIFIKENSVTLISGIAGIGKTWLLMKCLLDWSNNLIWKNVDLVFYFECRWLNQYPKISNINELLNFFYKNILNNFNISNHTALFIIDGLDEFKYFHELLNPSVKCNYPIVNTLAEIQKYKYVIAGRVYAIDQYQDLLFEQSNKLTIQIMGFNENGINNYVENHVMEKKEVVKTTLKESPIAKAMASVPFYLSLMCKILSGSTEINSNSFLTMTDLYANILLYFMQKHIFRTNKLIYEIMEDSSKKKYILDICKIAYKFFVENKIIFSKKEIQAFISDFDKDESNFLGFIEKIETNLECYYQFAHLTIMEFCASVYAYNCLSSYEIMDNLRLNSCLSMICGLGNKNQYSLLKFLVNLSSLNKSLPRFSIYRNSFSGNKVISCTGIIWILDGLIKSRGLKKYDANTLFIECFYESQSSFTDEIKSIFDKQGRWGIHIYNGKTSYLTSCENYFVKSYIKSGGKLSVLRVDKNILSEEEKNLLNCCLTNVFVVELIHLINFEGWKPNTKIEWLKIVLTYRELKKEDFEENFLPWINLCEVLWLGLNDKIDFIKDIYEWIRNLDIKSFYITYRCEKFCNLDELKNFIKC